MSTQSKIVGTSSRSNTVTIISSLITSIEYIPGSLVISEGQPASPPPSFSQSGDKWTITLSCGRHKTSEVADSFDTTTGGGDHEYAPSGGGGGTPDELNFYFGVTMTFSQQGAPSISADIYLGQGSYGTTNNWWIGGNWVINKGSLNPPNPFLFLINDNIIEQILALSGSNDSFTMTAS